MRPLLKFSIVAILTTWAGLCQAQQQVRICTDANPICQPVTSGNPLPVSASVSASITGFRPVSAGTPISVTTGGVTGTLPTNTGTVVATNVGTTNGAYCSLGGSTSTSAQYIAPNGGWFAFAISGDTQLTCITSTSTTTVNMVGGSGLPTGTGGGGGSGGGGGGAVTIASGAVASGAYSSGSIASGAFASGAFATGSGTDGWNVTEGAKADSVCGTATGTCSLVALNKFIANAVNSAIPAGTNVIGAVLPYSAPAANVSGSATSTNTSAHTIIAAGSGSLKNYITGVQCGRSDAGTAAIVITFSDAAATVLVLPNNGGGGGNNATFPIPIATAAATAFTFTSGTSTTTVYCSAQGYQAL